jgi:hypothetical protein
MNVLTDNKVKMMKPHYRVTQYFHSLDFWSKFETYLLITSLIVYDLLLCTKLHCLLITEKPMKMDIEQIKFNSQITEFDSNRQSNHVFLNLVVIYFRIWYQNHEFKYPRTFHYSCINGNL